MPLRPMDVESTERILVFGPSGSSKSFAFMTIARLAARTRSDAMFYIVNTDRSVARMLTDKGFRPDLIDENGRRKNIISEDADDWQSVIDSVTRFQDKMRPQDWLCIDLFDPCWQWAQDFFSWTIFKKGFQEYSLEVRKALQDNPNDTANKMKRGGFEGYKDWPVINSIWGTLRSKIIRSPGNVYCTAGIKSLPVEADRESRATFGAHGVLPTGQKHMAFDFQTVLQFSNTLPGVYEVITIKDRAREDMHGVPMGADVGKDFAFKYLVQRAGWRM